MIGALAGATIVACAPGGAVHEVPACDPLWLSCPATDARCPPPPPYGIDPQQTLADTVFTDCEGRRVHLHGLCGSSAIVLVSFYGWCASCYSVIDAVDAIATDYADRGLRALLVVAEMPNGDKATTGYCQGIRELRGWDLQAVVDPQAAFEVHGTTEVVLVLDRELGIAFKAIGPSEGSLRQAVSEVLDAAEGGSRDR